MDQVLEGNEEAGKHVIAEAARWAAEAGVECDTELAWGRVADVICRVAQERECDLIVVGSRGLTGFKRLMLGSISNAVAAKAPCPVLVVKWYES
jgi:nucleotide-binding universal stress UspA family protein